MIDDTFTAKLEGLKHLFADRFASDQPAYLIRWAGVGDDNTLILVPLEDRDHSQERGAEWR